MAMKYKTLQVGLMYIVNVPIQIKEGFKEQFVAGIKENASHAQNEEPGCLRFNVIQDSNDINRIWVCEVYKYEDAFKAHQQSPHYLKFRGIAGEWREDTSTQEPEEVALISGHLTMSGRNEYQDEPVALSCSWRITIVYGRMESAKGLEEGSGVVVDRDGKVVAE